MQCRSFISTEHGSIGFVQDHAQVGDLIYVLHDVSTPLVLQPRTYDENVYELIGESYVHGLMYGESLDIYGRHQMEEFLMGITTTRLTRSWQRPG